MQGKNESCIQEPRRAIRVHRMLLWIFPPLSAPAAFASYSSMLTEFSPTARYGRSSAQRGEKIFEPKGFHAHDGIGISLARLGGIHTGVITKRTSETVAQRARALRMEYVYMGQDYKIRALREIMQRGSFTLDQIAYVGDDMIDLPVMRVCGLAIASANARDQVKAAAHYITPKCRRRGSRTRRHRFHPAGARNPRAVHRGIHRRAPRAPPVRSERRDRWRMLSLWVER